MKIMCSHFLYVGRLVVLMLAISWPIESLQAAEFFCPSGNVACLIAAINEANGMPGEHVINLEPGTYTLEGIDNGEPFGNANGLPVIGRSIRIRGSAEDLPTVIERNLNAPRFRIFEVAAGGELTLDDLTIQRGALLSGAAAILNRGLTSLQDTIVTDSNTDFDGAIQNIGTLRVIRSIISDNFGGHVGGGIQNRGSLLVENSTIAHNASADGGGIFNLGSLVIRNSAIVFNSTDCCQPGGGILNLGGSVEMINSTIAKNRAGIPGGGGLSNHICSSPFCGTVGQAGRVSIINSTIAENVAGGSFLSATEGAGIANFGGTLQIQNTVVARNVSSDASATVSDCAGTITSVGNNLIGDPGDCDISLQPSDVIGDPGLGALVGTGENDPPARAFYPVLAGSVVINRGNPAACPETDQLGNPRVGICDVGAVEFQGRMLVSVDVRPRSDANKINPGSSKKINVAIFSGNGFDATTVDPNTVRFGATGTEATPIHFSRRDIDRDGQRDLVVRFEILDTGIKCGHSSVTLTGEIVGGGSFIGSSPIRTVHCKENQPKISAKLK